MKWTKEKPTEPGWYWYRHNHTDPDIIFWDGEERLSSQEDAELINLEWAGPILEPEEQ